MATSPQFIGPAPLPLDGRETIVHWSRVQHAADNKRTSKVFGVPRMQTVFNYLINIRRILGGSAEMFWNGGFPGMAFEVPPEIAAEVELDTESLAKEAEDYFKGFKRWLALRGVTANQLMPNIASPDSHLEVQLLAICIAIGVPMRIFLGTEEARLASIQDKDTWNRKIHRRNNKYVIPDLLRPLIDRLIALRVISRPSNGEYFTKWPDVYAISEIDKADVTGKLVKAMAEYIKSGAYKMFPPLQFLTMLMNLSEAEAEEVLDAAEEAASSGELDFIAPESPMEGSPAGIEDRGIQELDRPAGPQRRILRNELTVNPVTRCTSGGQPGFKWGQSGKCYTYTPSDSASRRRARRKARLQGIAVEASRRLSNMEVEDERLSNPQD
jgi:hypothetical protein